VSWAPFEKYYEDARLSLGMEGSWSRPRQLHITKCIVLDRLVERQLCGQLSLFVARDVHDIYDCHIKVIKTPRLYVRNSPANVNICPFFFFFSWLIHLS
jgi:hypothetical protein